GSALPGLGKAKKSRLGMAAIEELIKTVADPRLRDALAFEVSRLKATKRFGLVFEEHLPEIVILPTLPVKVGARVVKKGGGTDFPYRVIDEVNGRKVKVVPDSAVKSGIIHGLPESVVAAAEA